MNEPGTPVIVQHDLGFTLEPYHVTVAGNYSIAGADGLAGEKYLGSLHAPALFIVRMDLLVPADRVFQPFITRESQRHFNVRTDVGWADALIEVGDENNRRELLNQRAITGFDVGRRLG